MGEQPRSPPYEPEWHGYSYSTGDLKLSRMRFIVALPLSIKRKRVLFLNGLAYSPHLRLSERSPEVPEAAIISLSNHLEELP